MSKVPESYDFSDSEDILEIKRQLSDMYKILSSAINKKPDIYERETDGLTTDTSLSNGDININSSTGKIQMLNSHPTQTSVNWIDLS